MFQPSGDCSTARMNTSMTVSTPLMTTAAAAMTAQTPERKFWSLCSIG